MNEGVVLLLILIAAASSLLLVESAYSSISKPSVPEFTLQYVDYSYDVAPKTTSTIDPYTNETTTTTIPGYHVENKTIRATISNNIGASHYNFRYKGHYEDEWNYYPFRPGSSGYSLSDAYSVPYEASNSDYTVAALPANFFKDVSEGGEVDVQVQALFGDFRAVPYGHVQPLPAPTYDFYFEGTTSDWSDTQTIAISTSTLITPDLSDNNTVTTAKPSVPEFTVELVDSSYDVPTTYSIDPYTGENVTHSGYHVECKTIQFKIKNQPFVSYYDSSSSWTINFYYNIRYKGHYSEDWTEIWLASDGYPHQDSESNNTVFSFQGEYSATEGLEFNAGSISTRLPSDAEVDFQVEAMIGYISRVYVPNYTGPNMYPYRLTGERSGWSETQTLTLNVSESTNPEIPEQPDAENESSQLDQSTLIFAGALILIPIAAGLGLLIYLRKRQQH